MAWVKVPKENHPLFHAALPKDHRVRTVQLFGSIAGMVNGNMFCGLFARSAIVKLDDTDYAAAMALDGAEPFDPMAHPEQADAVESLKIMVLWNADAIVPDGQLQHIAARDKGHLHVDRPRMTMNVQQRFLRHPQQGERSSASHAVRSARCSNARVSASRSRTTGCAISRSSSTAWNRSARLRSSAATRCAC